MHVLKADTYRKSQFKQTVTTEDGYRRREETTLKIRKQKKDQLLKKKRAGHLAGKISTASELKAALVCTNRSGH